MSVRDKRPPFAWVSHATLERIRRDVPSSRQIGARNAVLALAEAASQRHDGQHADGDTLRILAGLAAMSERRLRDHLQDLAKAGIVVIEAETDETGRDRPTIYTLREPPRSDESSDHAAARQDGSSGYPDSLASQRPTSRARPDGVELQEEDPPQPPASGGSTTFPVRPDGYRAHGRKRKEDTAYDGDVAAFVAEHFPGIPVGLVSHFALELRSVGTVPTVDAMRPLVDQHRPCAEAA